MSSRKRLVLKQGTQELLSKKVESFLVDCKVRSLSPATIENYDNFLRIFLISIKEKNKKVDELCSEDVSNFILYQRKERGCNDSTIVNRLKILKAFLRFCELEDKVKIPKIKEPRTHKMPYTNEELSLLLAKPKKQTFVQWRNYTAVNFLIGTGVRCSTLCDIRISDLDFTNNTIFLNVVKNRKQYYIPMSSELKAIIKYYLSLYDHEDTDYLFVTAFGDKMDRLTMKQAIKEYNHSRGVSRSSIHLYRHTFAYNALKNGMPLPYLQQILGHSNIQTTMQYLRITVEDLQQNFDDFCPLDNTKRKGIKLKK